jgi:hypothetical protein
MKEVTYVATFIGGLVFCYLMISLGVVDKVDGIPGTEQEPVISLPTYLGFLSVMLTAVTVVLAAVAVGVGVVAFYTFPGIKTEAAVIARTAAAESAKDVASEALAEVKVRRMVEDLYLADKKDREQRQEWDGDPIDETR